MACVSAGHRRPRDQPAEAEPGLLPDLGRRPRGPAAWPWPVTCDRATTGSSPTTATRPSCSASASRRTRSCCRRSARPTTPRRAAARCRRHWGDRERNIVTQSSPTGSQCLPAVGCAEAGRYIVRRPQPRRLAGPRRRAHLRLASARAPVARASSGRASTPRAPCTCRCSTSCADNGYAISVPTDRPAAGAGVRDGARLPRAGGRTARRHRLLRRSASGAAEAIAHVRAGVGPGARPRRRHPARTRTPRPTPRRKYRPPDELADEAAHDPIDRSSRSWSRPGLAHARRGRPASGPRPTRDRGRGGAERRSPRAAPDPATVTRPRRTACPIARDRRRADEPAATASP